MFIIIMIIILAVGFGLQYIFGMFQIKNFTKHYTELRRNGKVAIGRKPAIFQSGTLVLLQINKKKEIEEARYMQGVTVFSRVKKLKGLEGLRIDKIIIEDVKSHNRLLRNAIMDAKRTYNIIQGGGEVEKIPSPFMKAATKVNQMFSKKEAK